MKTCRICKLEKPLDQFYARAKSGKQRNLCKSCHHDQNKAYYWKNRPIIRRQQWQRYWATPEWRQRARENAANWNNKHRNPEKTRILIESRLANAHSGYCARYKHTKCEDGNCVCNCHD